MPIIKMQATLSRGVTTSQLDGMMDEKKDNGYGVNITKIVDAMGKKLNYTVNKTMMRVDLLTPLKPGQQFIFNDRLEL
jgi:hypothetical protein